MRRSIGIVWVGGNLRLASLARREDKWTGRALISDEICSVIFKSIWEIPSQQRA